MEKLNSIVNCKKCNVRATIDTWWQKSQYSIICKVYCTKCHKEVSTSWPEDDGKPETTHYKNKLIAKWNKRNEPREVSVSTTTGKVST